MERNEILEKVNSVLRAQLGIEFLGATEDKYLLDDLTLDSLDVVEFTMGIEEAFDIEVDDDAAENHFYGTVAVVVDYLLRRLAPDE